MKRTILLLLISSLSLLACSPKITSTGLNLSTEWQSSLDKDLNHCDKFIRVPHSSVEIKDHPTSENVPIRTSILSFEC